MPGPGYGYGYGAVGNARRAPLIAGAGTPTPTPTPGPSLPALANIVGHFDSAAITPQTDNTALAQWNDSSGSGAHATQATGANQPKYRTSGLNGKPCVEFDGNGYFGLDTPGAIRTAMDSQSYTVLAVVENAGDGSGGYGNIFGAAAGGTAPWLWATATQIGWSSASNNGAVAPNPSAGGYMMLGMTCALASGLGGSGGGQLIRHVYRGTVYGSNVAAPLVTGATNIRIGASGAGGTFRFKGRIYRIIVWDRMLTSAELMQAEAYFNDAYAQTHPAVTKGSFLHFDGDSRTVGVGGNPTADARLPYLVATGLGYPLGSYTLHAIGGLSVQQCINKGGEVDAVAQAVDALGPTIKQRLIYEEFFNSRSLAVGDMATAGTLAYQTKQYVTARRAGMPSTLKIVGQSPCDHADLNSPAASPWASYIQTNWAALGFDALADVWASPLGSDAACPNSAPWAPWADGVHLDTSGQTTQAGVIVNACTALAGW